MKINVLALGILFNAAFLMGYPYSHLARLRGRRIPNPRQIYSNQNMLLQKRRGERVSEERGSAREATSLSFSQPNRFENQALTLYNNTIQPTLDHAQPNIKASSDHSVSLVGRTNVTYRPESEKQHVNVPGRIKNGSQSLSQLTRNVLLNPNSRLQNEHSSSAVPNHQEQISQNNPQRYFQRTPPELHYLSQEPHHLPSFISQGDRSIVKQKSANNEDRQNQHSTSILENSPNLLHSDSDSQSDVVGEVRAPSSEHSDIASRGFHSAEDLNQHQIFQGRSPPLINQFYSGSRDTLENVGPNFHHQNNRFRPASNTIYSRRNSFSHNGLPSEGYRNEAMIHHQNPYASNQANPIPYSENVVSRDQLLLQQPSTETFQNPKTNHQSSFLESLASNSFHENNNNFRLSQHAPEFEQRQHESHQNINHDTHPEFSNQISTATSDSSSPANTDVSQNQQLLLNEGSQRNDSRKSGSEEVKSVNMQENPHLHPELYHSESQPSTKLYKNRETDQPRRQNVFSQQPQGPFYVQPPFSEPRHPTNLIYEHQPVRQSDVYRESRYLYPRYRDHNQIRNNAHNQALPNRFRVKPQSLSREMLRNRFTNVGMQSEEQPSPYHMQEQLTPYNHQEHVPSYYDQRQPPPYHFQEGARPQQTHKEMGSLDPAPQENIADENEVMEMQSPTTLTTESNQTAANNSLSCEDVQCASLVNCINSTLSGCCSVCTRVACPCEGYQRYDCIANGFEDGLVPEGESYSVDMGSTVCQCPSGGGAILCSFQTNLGSPNAPGKSPKIKLLCPPTPIHCIETYIRPDGCAECLSIGCVDETGERILAGSSVTKSACNTCYCPAEGGEVFCLLDQDCYEGIHNPANQGRPLLALESSERVANSAILLEQSKETPHEQEPKVGYDTRYLQPDWNTITEGANPTGSNPHPNPSENQNSLLYNEEGRYIPGADPPRFISSHQTQSNPSQTHDHQEKEQRFYPNIRQYDDDVTNVVSSSTNLNSNSTFLPNSHKNIIHPFLVSTNLQPSMNQETQRDDPESRSEYYWPYNFENSGSLESQRHQSGPSHVNSNLEHFENHQRSKDLSQKINFLNRLIRNDSNSTGDDQRINSNHLKEQMLYKLNNDSIEADEITSFENVLSACCFQGRQWAMTHEDCQTIPSNPGSYGQICEVAQRKCCSESIAQKKCGLGIANARMMRSCGGNPQGNCEEDGFKVCCDCCALGLKAHSLSLSCDMTILGEPCNRAYSTCCREGRATAPLSQTSSSTSSPSTSSSQSVAVVRTCESQNCSHRCAVNEGRARCACFGGFELQDDGKTCTDINECARGNHGCLEGQFCLNLRGSYRCQRLISCGTGYELTESNTCIDIDECALNIDNCGPRLDCVNIRGSFRCVPKLCDEGYFTDATGGCIDIDECRGGDFSCPPQSSCKNTDGSYTCICSQGFQFNTARGVCEDIDECSLSVPPCSEGSTCKNTDGSFVCTDVLQLNCRQGYEPDSALRSCIDVDECVRGTHTCASGSTCINDEGNFRCEDPIVCPPGTRPSSDQRTCSDINECRDSARICGKGAQCVNTHGSYVCECTGGYEKINLRSEVGACRDIDECALSESGKCIYQCENNEGSFSCVCPQGYTASQNGRLCNDIDECAQHQDNCSTSQTCFNTRGSFKCVDLDCPAHYAKLSRRRCLRQSCRKSRNKRACIRLPKQISFHNISLLNNTLKDKTLFRMSLPTARSGDRYYFFLTEGNEDGAFRVVKKKQKKRLTGVVYTTRRLKGPRDYVLDLTLKLYRKRRWATFVSRLYIYLSEFEF